MTLTVEQSSPDGRIRQTTKTYQVAVPEGATNGKRLRLSGQGGDGGSGKPGDLYFTIKIAPHTRFKVRGKNIETNVPVTPSEAVLGATIQIPLIKGTAEITLPPGIQEGKRIRVKGKGLGSSRDGKGDLYARIHLAVPNELTSRERALYEELAEISSFDPRKFDN